MLDGTLLVDEVLRERRASIDVVGDAVAVFKLATQGKNYARVAHGS